LDSFGGLSKRAEAVRQNYSVLLKCKQILEDLLGRARDLEEKSELYRFQLNEIKEAKVVPEEIRELESRGEILENIESLLEMTSSLYDLLYNSDDSISDVLGSGRKLLEGAVKIDKKLEGKLENYDSLIYQVVDLGSSLKDYVDSLESDPNELEFIRERLALISRLKKKYGNTVEGIIKKREFLERELGNIDDLGSEIERASNDLEKARSELAKSSLKLSSERHSVAKTLCEISRSVMYELGMEGAELEVRFTPRKSSDGELTINDERYEASAEGIERVEFYILTNPGEEKKPLVKIASGGEISRVMLALKSVLAESDAVPTLIFDEIDIGISGRIAEAVGRQLRVLSDSHQTICITHLPQIAKMAESHFSVIKARDRGRSVTRAFLLDDDGRKRELAKLLGGEEITDITFRHAEELLKKGKN
jgi:DNA repair protein RecN (Recombination protein N)